MRKRSISQHVSLIPNLQRRQGDYGPPQREASRDFGPTLYAVAIGDDEIKIGYTRDVVRRVDHLRCSTRQPCRILAVHRGTTDNERELHRALAAHRSHGREYYHRTAEVLALVDRWRAELGQAPLADGQAAVRR